MVAPSANDGMDFLSIPTLASLSSTPALRSALIGLRARVGGRKVPHC
jgi:hypothetical protein